MTETERTYELAEAFEGLREQVFALSTETMEARDGVFALLMETGYAEAVVAVLAAADGSASLYFSNGGGIIGAGEYEQVREVVFETSTLIRAHADAFETVDVHPLPTPGQTRFFVVADRGVLSAAVQQATLVADQHALAPLFHQVHKLIAFIRAAEEHRQGRNPA
ncbi:MAG: hypothetical protein AAFZ58_02880 [Pseudomonadota bacterium]